jgi:SAM-dependent methyltransferase
LTGEGKIAELRRFFDEERGPGRLTSVALGEPAGRSVAVAALRRRWREVLGEVRGRRALELGCGHGGEMAYLVREGATVVGIDLSTRRLDAARAIAPGAAVLLADAERLPFGDGAFSLVYGNSVLLHLDRAGAFSEIGRVLEPGGKAVFFEPLDRHPVLRMYRTLFTRRRGLARYPSLEELEGLSLGGGTEVSPWYLTAALPVFAERLVGTSAFTRGLAVLLSRLDDRLFRRGRWAARHAWTALAVYRKG